MKKIVIVLLLAASSCDYNYYCINRVITTKYVILDNPYFSEYYYCCENGANQAFRDSSSKYSIGDTIK